jgi:hypothetical protein
VEAYGIGQMCIGEEMLANLTPNEMMTLGIAAYAALLSTFVFGWDAYKWLSQGPKIRCYAQIGMKIVGTGRIDPKTYVSITAVNYGDRPTTITNMGFLYYDNWFNAYIYHRRTKAGFIVAMPSQAQVIPYRFEPGAQWIGMADQDAQVDKMIQEGYLFAVLYCSTVGKGVRFRLKRKEHISA